MFQGILVGHSRPKNPRHYRSPKLFSCQCHLLNGALLNHWPTMLPPECANLNHRSPVPSPECDNTLKATHLAHQSPLNSIVTVSLPAGHSHLIWLLVNVSTVLPSFLSPGTLPALNTVKKKVLSKVSPISILTSLPFLDI